MNGAESLVHTLLGSGVEVCFANPGTSEMHFVAALDRIPGMRCILGLQENIVTGAADGYWRMAEKPAATRDSGLRLDGATPGALDIISIVSIEDSSVSWRAGRLFFVFWAMKPDPAGISLPMITFSFRPRS